MTITSPTMSLRSTTVTASDSPARLAILNAVFQGTPNIVVVLSPVGQVVDANRSALSFAECSRTDVIGQLLWHTPGWKRRLPLAAWLEQAIQSELRDAGVAQRLFSGTDAEGNPQELQFVVRELPERVEGQSYLELVALNVTDRVESEKRERARERHYRAALDASQDAFVIARAIRDESGAIVEFRIVDANARAVLLADQPLEGLIGRSLLEAYPQSRNTGVWDQCCRVVATRTPSEHTEMVPIPGVPVRWVSRQIVPIDDGVAISSRDISQQERERTELAASEARYRELFESSAVIKLLVDEETGALIDVNPAAAAFYGWPREAMRAMQIADIERGALIEWHEAVARDTREGHKSPLLRVHYLASGERRFVDVAMSPVKLGERSARHLILHDVTDRVSAETQLRESEARFRAVIRSMSEGVVVHDATGAIREFNPSAEQILGLSGEELMGLRPLARDWHAVREDGTEWQPADHPAMLALKTGQSQTRTMMGIRRGNAEHAWLQVSADPLIRAGETKPYGAVAVFADVTVQRGAEERLREAQKLEAVGQLAGGIAHDFNNLLTVIRGSTGFLLESLSGHAPQRDDVRAIERAAERAEDLTRRLLAIGRRQLLRPEPVDLSALVQDQFGTIRNDLPRTIRLQLSPSEERVIAQLDRRQMLDALRALVDNARHAMPNGGTLTLATSLKDGYAMLEVRDTGEGMSEEVRARLFEPFFTTQPFGGNKGMGLASVHGMVAQSQGFIECDSAPGKGTSLRLFFPEAARAERERSPAQQQPAVENRAVLIVDDDPMIRELGRRMLEKLGHSVTAAESGADAMSLLSSNAERISVIVTDLTMPGMNGMELIDAVEKAHPHLPVVAISGFSMNPKVRQELDARRVPFVGKPFVAADLARAIERALAQRV